MCKISLIVFTDKYLGRAWTFYTNGIVSLSFCLFIFIEIRDSVYISLIHHVKLPLLLPSYVGIASSNNFRDSRTNRALNSR